MVARPGVTYVLHPRPVYSRTDGQYHYVGFMDLALLYGVDPRACVKADPYRHLDDERYVHLYPDSSGAYKLPQGRGKK